MLCSPPASGGGAVGRPAAGEPSGDSGRPPWSRWNMPMICVDTLSVPGRSCAPTWSLSCTSCVPSRPDQLRSLLGAEPCGGPPPGPCAGPSRAHAPASQLQSRSLAACWCIVAACHIRIKCLLSLMPPAPAGNKIATSARKGTVAPLSWRRTSALQALASPLLKMRSACAAGLAA